jgi:hypothetical protein
LARATPDDWTDERVVALVEAVVRADRDPDVAHRPALAAIVEAHPAVALEAANRVLFQRPASFRGLALFSTLDPAHLEGDRYATIRQGLEKAHEVAANEFIPQHVPVDWEARARERLDDPDADDAAILGFDARWRTETLDEAQRERLAEVVERNWPTDGSLRAMHRFPSTTDESQALGAIRAGAALNLPLSARRWMEILRASNLRHFADEAFGWLRQQYRPELDGEIVRYVASTSDGMDLSCVIVSVSSSAHEVLDAVVDRLDAITIDSGGWNNAVGLLADRGNVDALRTIAAGPRTSIQAMALAYQLARHGDPDAQLTVLDELVERAADRQRLESPYWRIPVTDPLVARRLGALIAELGPDSSAKLHQFAVGQLGVAETDEALVTLDELIARFGDDEFGLTRDTLARRLAAQEILRRLPATLGEAALLLEHG